MSKHLVLYIKPYDFQNTQGERVQGAKVAYVNKKPSSRENEFGHSPLLVSISDMDLVKTLHQVPGIYELEFEQVTGKNNKPELVLSEAEFIKPIDLQALFS